MTNESEIEKSCTRCTTKKPLQNSYNRESSKTCIDLIEKTISAYDDRL